MHIEPCIRRKTHLSMTSLIDVIFLLLLFFMLSSTFTRFATLNIETSSTGAGGAQSQRPEIFIRLGLDGWSVNGATLDEHTAITELVRLQQNGAKAAVLLARDDVTSQALLDGLERIQRETVLSVNVWR